MRWVGDDDIHVVPQGEAGEGGAGEGEREKASERSGERKGDIRGLVMGGSLF